MILPSSTARMKLCFTRFEKNTFGMFEELLLKTWVWFSSFCVVLCVVDSSGMNSLKETYVLDLQL